MKIMPASPKSKASLSDQLAKARLDLEAARDAAERIANEEAANLGSDELFTGWLRKKRVAEQDQQRLEALITSLENQIDAAEHTAKLEVFAARWTAVAERSVAVKAMYEQDLPQAWEIVAKVIEAAAQLEIDRQAIIREMPVGFEPPVSIHHPEMEIRCLPCRDETILKTEIVNMMTDREGRLFVDQSCAAAKRGVSRPFRHVHYLAHQTSSQVLPFWQQLVFPRLSSVGGPLYDGTKTSSPQEALAALRMERPVDVEREPMLRIEPIRQSSVANFDGPPAI
jgi:hypothetical protein